MWRIAQKWFSRPESWRSIPASEPLSVVRFVSRRS